MATALVEFGRDPQTIRSVAELVQPEALKTALNFFWTRNGNRKTAQLHNFALTAIKIAKWWVKAPAEQIAELQKIRREVDPKETGMTPRNRARLRQFDDPEILRRLIGLPQVILRALPREGAPSYDQALRVQSALAISILTTAPMRMRNVASLRLGQHIVQTRPGGVRHIVIPAEEVKNRTPLAFEVSDALGGVIDVYLARCRPRLARDPEDLLFPARKGGAKTPAVRYRDGLLIALLAYRPVRRRNLAMMRLGRHLMKVGGSWRIVFGAEETKTHVPYEAVLLAALGARLERYLDLHRPVLMRGRQEAGNPDAPPIHPELDAVWVSEVGTQLSYQALGIQIFVRTRREFGRGLFPHMFRDCVATAVAVDNPKHIGDASLILGHSEHRTTEKHYNHARSLDASRRHAAMLATLGESLKANRNR
jgi:integrase